MATPDNGYVAAFEDGTMTVAPERGGVGPET